MGHELIVTTGERRDSDKTVRTYCFYVSPTGKESGISACPHLKRLSSSPKGARPGTLDRVLEVEYSVEHPVLVKLFTDCTVMGKPKQSYEIYIEVSATAPEIRMTGVEGFGMFKGHGKILFERSNVSKEQLKQDFSYEVLKAPLVSQNEGTRNLIFLKRGKKT